MRGCARVRLALVVLAASFACGSKASPPTSGDGAAGVGGAGSARDAAAGSGDGAGADGAGGAGTDAAVGGGDSVSADRPGGGAGAGGASMTPTEACRAAITALCSRVAFCVGETIDECTNVASFCPDYYFNSDSNRSVSAVVACLPAISALTCTDIYRGAYPACIASGKKAPGAGCNFASQCQTNDCSYPTPNCRSCGAGGVSFGQSCATVGCEGGSCDPQTKICVDARTTIYAAEGQPCDSTLNPPVGCMGDLVCIGKTTGGDQIGTCSTGPGLGQPCASAWLSALICARGSHCDAGTCVRDGACGDALTCDASSMCQAGDGGFACVPKPMPRVDDEPCDAQNACAYGLTCNAAGTCEPMPYGCP